MQPHEERVVAEKSDLDAKIEKLSSFLHGSIYPTLPEPEQARLTHQLTTMRTYSDILHERIAAFEKAQSA